MIRTTRAQREALFRVFQRDFSASFTPRSPQYRQFRRTVLPGPGCLMLPWHGMWLGIEPDGYTHS